MTKTLLVIVLLVVSSFAAHADKFKPFEVASVTYEQWLQYRGEVEDLHGDSEQRVPDQNLIVYFNSEDGMYYAFTTEGHLAHPAWITRQVVESDNTVNIKQIGYFAGKEKPFAKLFQQYLDLNDKIKASMQSEN